MFYLNRKQNQPGETKNLKETEILKYMQGENRGRNITEYLFL